MKGQNTAPHDLVRCRFCNGTYRLGEVEVTARYADCSVWKTPCCGQTADDRGETGWKPIGDYTRVKDEPLHQMDQYGRMWSTAAGLAFTEEDHGG